MTRDQNDIAQHFNENGHRGLTDVEIHIKDFIHCTPESERAKKLRHAIEKNWIFRLRTQIPDVLDLIALLIVLPHWDNMS